MKLTPFNLSAALAGKPCVHKDGSKVIRIAHFPEANENFRVVVLLGPTTVYTYTEDGRYLTTGEPFLFMVEEPQRIPFDIELWKSGKYDAVCRDGSKPLELYMFELSDTIYPVGYTAANKTLVLCRKDGTVKPYGNESNFDLFLIER